MNFFCQAARMSLHHALVRLGMELGLAVSDYNSRKTEHFDDIVKVTLEYLATVKEGVRQGLISEKELQEYFSLVGQSWGCIMYNDEQGIAIGTVGRQTNE
jgi:hypothetical protein